MGVDTNTNIGPYMIVRGEKTGLVNREVRTCLNSQCQTNISNQKYVDEQNFCAECGSKVGIKKYQEMVRTKPYQMVWDGFEDELCWTDPMGCGDGVFIANHYCPIKRNQPEDDFEGITDLMNVNIQEEIGWFNEKYKGVIDMFKRELGENSVEVRWGVIEWYS